MKSEGSKQVKIFDITLRDGSQSKVATRIRLEDLLKVARNLAEQVFTVQKLGEELPLTCVFASLGKTPGKGPGNSRRSHAESQEYDAHPWAKFGSIFKFFR